MIVKEKMLNDTGMSLLEFGYHLGLSWGIFSYFHILRHKKT